MSCSAGVIVAGFPVKSRREYMRITGARWLTRRQRRPGRRDPRIAIPGIYLPAGVKRQPRPLEFGQVHGSSERQRVGESR